MFYSLFFCLEINRILWKDLSNLNNFGKEKGVNALKLLSKGIIVDLSVLTKRRFFKKIQIILKYSKLERHWPLKLKDITIFFIIFGKTINLWKSQLCLNRSRKPQKRCSTRVCLPTSNSIRFSLILEKVTEKVSKF